MNDEPDFISHYLSIYYSLYLTIAHECNGMPEPSVIDKIHHFIFKRAKEDGSLSERGDEGVSDYCNRALDESINLHEMLLDVGPAAIFQNYSFLIGTLGSYTGPGRYEQLSRIYNELYEIAEIDGDITTSQRKLLEKTAEAWGLDSLIYS